MTERPVTGAAGMPSPAYRTPVPSRPTGGHPVVDPSNRWEGSVGPGRNRMRGALLASWLVLCCSLVRPAAGAGGELSPFGEEARPSFSLHDLSGQQVSLAAFRGKVLLVNFWASWCRPCVDEMPGIRRLRAALRDRPFEVIGVNVGETPARARTAARRLDLDFPVLLDRHSEAFDDWGAQILPTSYVLDASGEVRYRALGPLEWDAAPVVTRLRALADDDSAVRRTDDPAPGR